MNLYDVFSTRELAVMIWVTIGLTWTLCYTGIRKKYVSLLETVFAAKIMGVFLAMMVYVTAMIIALWSVHLWYPALLKDTIFWFIFAAFVPIFKISEAGSDNRYFRRLVREIFTLTVSTEFIVNYFTFSLWKELILVPVLWLMAMLLVVSEKQKQHAIVNRFLKNLLKWLSVALALYVGVQLVTHWKTFFSWATLGSLSVSPLLSLLYIPFLFGLSLVMEYENAFSRLKLAVPAPLYAFAKHLAMMKWKGNKKALDRWTMRLIGTRPQSKNELIASVSELQRQLAIERNPPAVDTDDGWSPYTAKHFMTSLGMPTREYENYIMEEWSCTSDYLYPDKRTAAIIFPIA